MKQKEVNSVECVTMASELLRRRPIAPGVIKSNRKVLLEKEVIFKANLETIFGKRPFVVEEKVKSNEC